MIKICFVGAGSSVFAKNVLGDCMLTDSLHKAEIALYDIDATRLNESYEMLTAVNNTVNKGEATIKTYLGVENRKEALRSSDFVVTAIQVGGYEPSTVIDFEIPKKFGLRQTIADTLGIGGIMRGLRTMPVFESIARDMEEVAPHAWLLNYVNPMSIITGFMQRYTAVNTVGLCHSVQSCVPNLFRDLGIKDKLPETRALIAGINHQGWLLELHDLKGNDIYPEVRKLAAVKNASEKHHDMVRYEYIKHLGYYCTESSEHNAEYNSFFIKKNYPELIEKFNIPLDEYPRRCIEQMERWKNSGAEILSSHSLTHERSEEYASYIMESIANNKPYKIGGNVINNGLISNLPSNACVEVPCLIDGSGIKGTYVGDLPLQLAGMNSAMIHSQLLTIEAHVTGKKEAIYQAAMMDPHTSGELSIDDIVAMCDELIEAHGDFLPKYR